MINYLSVLTREGDRTLTIMNTKADNIEKLIENAKTVRNLSNDFDRYDSVDVVVVKTNPEHQLLISAESLIADVVAERSPWTLYDEAGEVLGSGSGDWSTWHVNSPMIDGLIAARFALSAIEKARNEAFGEKA